MTVFIRRNAQLGRYLNNGRLAQYATTGENIPRNTFVEFVNASGMQKIKKATDKIDGITQTACTAATAGAAWVLNE